MKNTNLSYTLLKNTIGEKATGGDAYKYADLFKERLGMVLNKEDEMDCLVAGANSLLKVGSSHHRLILISSLPLRSVSLSSCQLITFKFSSFVASKLVWDYGM